MNNVLTRYMPDFAPEERLREIQLELVLLQWLTDLVSKPHEAVNEPEKSFAISGFLGAIRGASVFTEVQL